MVSLDDVKKAYREIGDTIQKTPILTSSLLNERCGMQVCLKAEHLQKTGSFKIRGATNAVKQAVAGGARFITAASSGNHGQAVAYIASQLGIPAMIVVPEDANRVKVEAIKAYQAEVEYCGLTSAERIPRAKQLAEDNHGAYIPPYDHPAVIAGQGTIAIEILKQVPDVDVIVVPVGGGGLIGGILCAAKALKPEVRVIGVEPETANDTFLSLQKGEITAISGTTTIADGLRTSQPGDLTFPILREHLDELVLVSEVEIKEAFQFLLERTKQLIEPSGATALAAVMAGKAGMADEKAAVILSGGNVDLYQIPHFLTS
ncbi:pyridoxal-5'-phosphate-dependent protein subunit beta [Planococcus antarcticus DSM 14505]|uniref:threonine ammonia-lyase n=1 Tax=Planococcus antarcticus DSM 14505 TaxID=1185653 RepID=A0A1C7DBZ7_9BACL|nr:threonine/serine dehydratase [Planococcus antarcticus]ANU09029.1 serine/threonine dehydratase [Planococcus antarcticus DSM 14505]EIM07279.1 pyridoxal-5'-phosphate-dependent protein subunit beta [Planococcus antarcticus DSM 14505]